MFSSRSIIIATTVAFIAGMVATLAIRDTGNQPIAEVDDTVETVIRYRWRVPMSAPRALPGTGETPQYLASALLKASGGEFVIDLFDPGEIVPAFAITDAVRDRKVPAGFTWLGYDQGKIPASALISAKPFGMEPWAYIGWWFHADGRELTDRIYAGHGMKPILCGIIGPETAGWFTEPLTSAQDLEGLKIRFAGLGGKVLQRLGASVTMLPAGEIFQALETGVIDATEFSQPVTDEALGFARIASYNYFPGWHQPFSTSHLVVNLETWKSLSTSDQGLLEGMCTSAVAFSLGLSETLQGPVITRFRDMGVTTSKLPEDMLNLLEKTTNQLLDEEAARDEEFAEILASQRAYHKVYREWHNLAYLDRDE